MLKICCIYINTPTYVYTYCTTVAYIHIIETEHVPALRKRCRVGGPDRKMQRGQRRMGVVDNGRGRRDMKTADGRREVMKTVGERKKRKEFGAR